MEAGAQTDVSMPYTCPRALPAACPGPKGGNLIGLSEGGVGKHRVDKVFDCTLAGHHGLTNTDDFRGALANAVSGRPLPCGATANHPLIRTLSIAYPTLTYPIYQARPSRATRASAASGPHVPAG